MSRDLPPIDGAAVGRPPKFSRTQIQAAALALVDQQGIDALTMRNVAGALGTGPMTLYRHVQDRADLEALVVDAIFSEVAVVPTGSGSEARVEELCVAVWRALRSHPHAARLTLTRRTQAPAALAVGEVLAAELGAAGLDSRQHLVAFRTILSLVSGSIESDLELGSSGSARGRVTVGDDDFPTLVRLSATSLSVDEEELFRATVRAGLAGVLGPARKASDA